MNQFLDNQNYRVVSKSKGVILLEIIIAIGLFSIVALPIMQFILIDSDSDVFRQLSTLVKKSIPSIERYEYSRSGVLGEESEIVSGALFNSIPDTNCDRVIAEISDIFFWEDGVADIEKMISVEENVYTPESLGTSTGAVPGSYTPTSIIAIPKHGSVPSEDIVLLGINSASTTQFDIALFERETWTEAGIKETFTFSKTYTLGPGVIAISKYKDVLIAIERSLVSPLWVSSVSAIHENVNSTKNSNSSEGATGTGINPWQLLDIPNIIGAYPKVVNFWRQYLLIGTEKHDKGELFIVRDVLVDQLLSSMFPDKSEVENVNDTYDSGIEIGAGVNDIKVSRNTLYIASPKNPELETYILQSRKERSNNTELASIFEIGVVPRKNNFLFDAPGSSGNGKTISIFEDDLWLGRTLGNKEIIHLDNSSATPQYKNDIDTNQSTIKIVPIFAGRLLLVLQKSLNKGLVLYQYIHGAYTEIYSKDLNAIPVGMACLGEDLLIAYQDPQLLFSQFRFNFNIQAP